MSEFFIPADFDFGQQFDRVTLTRAMALDPERALLSMQTDGSTLVTRLRGSGVHAYEQRIELPVDRRLGLRVRGHCSCPMGLNCKHVAAALMAFEAYEIKRRRNPAAAPPLAAASSPLSAMPAPASDPELAPLPYGLQRWLDELADLTPSPVVPPAAQAAPAAQVLMYLLSVQGPELHVRLQMSNLRKNGEVSAQRQNTSAPVDLLRHRPAYLADADLPLLAGLLALPALTAPTHLLLRGARAVESLRGLLATQRAWLQGSSTPVSGGAPGLALRWLDDEVPLALHWQAGADGLWRAGWRHRDTPMELVLLPAPHALDPGAGTVQPARLVHAALHDVELADWLARMPPVPADALASFVGRLQSVAAERHLELPLPAEHAREVRDLGALALQPVLRLTTCPEGISEAALRDPYGLPSSRGARVRQAAAELRLRYRPPAGPPLDFHFPAGAATSAFVRLPVDDDADAGALARFTRDGYGEGEAVQRLFGDLEMRPWNAVAGLALDRQARLAGGRMQSGALPSGLDDQPCIVVPRRREQWPVLLARQLPALEREGWAIETADDFPFETHAADTWEVQVAPVAAAGAPQQQEWFDVGLKVTVDGAAVDLVPLLVALVHSGVLLQENGSFGESAEPDEDILLPWPAQPPARGAAVPDTPTRQRLLRLPLARVAPIVEWLRTMVRGGERRDSIRLSRFDIGTLAALTRGTRVQAPPDFGELLAHIQRLEGAQGLPPVAVSPRVQAQLRHYQEDGLAWMDFMRAARLGGILADDMGLGKTLQALALLQAESDAGRLDLPSLVIVPTSLIDNWQSEAARFTPALELVVLHGPQRAQDFERIAAAQLVVTSYPLVVRDFGTLAAQQWHYIVLDEAQRIKNSRSQAALVLKDLRARHRLCLTGTPLENHLGELWSLMDFVCPGLLGSEAQFREHYRHPIERRRETARAESLARRVRPFILRRTKQQVARELPEKTETLLRVELGGAQADLYETVRATMDKKLRDAIARQGLAASRIMVLEALLKLRQVCCDPRLLKGGTAGTAKGNVTSAKLELLLELLPTLVDDGRRVLLFSQFTEMLELIEPELAKLKLAYLKLTGETKDRGAVVDDFQQGDAPLMLVSLRAGGVGLNLTAADTVILYDPWWNPAVEQQAIDRAYRIGQDKPVFVYKLVASGTVEDKMLELQARKAGLADQLLSGVASDAALDADDFDELFRPLAAPAA
ncbi:MAG: DEAD/DEAH box helicase [Proteobacteria bacterium]|nr:DEAD/DEAH box helicase [Pseudomonadota bacterium]